MGKKSFVPPAPRIEPPSQETIDRIKSMPPKDFRKEMRKMSKDPRIRKYTDPVKRREKMQRRDKVRKWWHDNWISMASIAISLASLVVSIIAILK